MSQLRPVKGLRLASTASGIKKGGDLDLVLIEIISGANCAVVFTRNSFCAAPVILAKEHLKNCDNRPRAFIINSGNANAGNGKQGFLDAVRCSKLAARHLGVEPEEVLTFSTGIIGEPLPVRLIEKSMRGLVENLSQDSWVSAASAILTTDTCSKGISKEIFIGGQKGIITGIAKGAGMIRPNMATMLAFIGTDLNVAPEVLQQFLQMAVEKSFHRITIDGDTSTNDACAIIATGTNSSFVINDRDSEEGNTFFRALEDVCVCLAQALIKDAEGATKFITLVIEEGLSEQECLDVAFTIAHSPLVKTALFASDPNWGRLLACIGRSGLVSVDVNLVSIFIGSELVVDNGSRAESYSESKILSTMQATDITIRILLGRGDCSATVWTSDLSYEYVKINAEYRS